MSLAENRYSLSLSRYALVMPWLVRLYAEIIHELQRVDYLTYRWTNMVNYFIPPTSVYILHITSYFVLMLVKVVYLKLLTARSLISLFNHTIAFIKQCSAAHNMTMKSQLTCKNDKWPWRLLTAVQKYDTIGMRHTFYHIGLNAVGTISIDNLANHFTIWLIQSYLDYQKSAYFRFYWLNR